MYIHIYKHIYIYVNICMYIYMKRARQTVTRAAVRAPLDSKDLYALSLSVLSLSLSFSLSFSLSYGVATISRLLKIIGLFCKRAL